LELAVPEDGHSPPERRSEGQHSLTKQALHPCSQFEIGGARQSPIFLDALKNSLGEIKDFVAYRNLSKITAIHKSRAPSADNEVSS